jgi:hypothetical protein
MKIVTCPKCQHVRAPHSAAPAWQCPACGIAYHKFAAWRARAQALAAPPRGGAPPTIRDGSLWALLAVNALALAFAVISGWSTRSLMLVYWGQSVVIGIANVLRILSLERFATDGLRMNGRPVAPTTATKLQVAAFFTLHFGFFHAVYLVFLLADADAPLMEPWLLAAVAGFALNHAWSYRYNVALDRRGSPNLGTLMFTPYLRIVPMHLTILCGGLLGDSLAALLLFGVLKTGADAGMHVVEHRQLRKARDDTAGATA